MPNLMATSAIIALAKERCDMTNSGFVQDPIWLAWFNESYRKFYNLLVSTYQDLYISTATINVVNGVDDYALPSDLLKLRLLEVNDGSPKPRTLRKWTLTDKNRIAYSVYDYPLRYILFAQKVKLIPTPTAAVTMTVYYIPSPVDVVNTAETREYWNGFYEYVVLDMAIKALGKEESPTDALVLERAQVEKAMLESLPDYDSSQPRAMTDITRINEGAIYPYVWGVPT